MLDKFPKTVKAASGIAGLKSLQQSPIVAVSPQVKIDEVMSLYEAKQFDTALQTIQTLVKVYPQFPGLYNIADVILAEAGQWDNAVKAYQQALGLKPDYDEAYLTMPYR